MPTIQHQIGIKRDKEAVFKALTTVAGLTDWWSRCSGAPDLEGEAVNFHFGEVMLVMTVYDLQPNESVIWKCVDCNPEWDVTRIRFQLSDGKNGQTMLDFYHEDWSAASSFYRHCSMKWATFLLSLKNYLETGKGQPAPNDVPINHD